MGWTDYIDREASERAAVRQRMTNPNVAIPTVHLNGTSGETLFRQSERAVGALEEALESVCRAAPNARDYYLQPAGFEPARREHDARVAKLREVRDEMIAILDGVEEQIDAQARR